MPPQDEAQRKFLILRRRIAAPEDEGVKPSKDLVTLLTQRLDPERQIVADL